MSLVNKLRNFEYNPIIYARNIFIAGTVGVAILTSGLGCTNGLSREQMEDYVGGQIAPLATITANSVSREQMEEFVGGQTENKVSREQMEEFVGGQTENKVSREQMEDYVGGQIAPLDGKITALERVDIELEKRYQELNNYIRRDVGPSLDIIKDRVVRFDATFQDYKIINQGLGGEITEGVQNSIDGIQTSIDKLYSDIRQLNTENRELSREEEKDVKDSIEELGDNIDQLRRDQDRFPPLVFRPPIVGPYRARNEFEVLDATRYGFPKEFVRDMYNQDSSKFRTGFRTGSSRWWDGRSSSSNKELNFQTALLVDELNGKARFYFDGTPVITTTIRLNTIEEVIKKFLDNNPHRAGDVTIYTPGPFYGP